MDQFIAGSEALEALSREVQNAPWVAIDTEFLRERTFRPKLCLIQVATPGGIYCVDPLVQDIDPLFAALEGGAIKIGHALRQDLEILHQRRGRLPAPLADTQIAAMLLGYNDQTGYAALVQAELGITLDKRHTRTDWSRRPLSEDQLRYAGNDVRHLPVLHERLGQRLAELGRLDWFEEECGRLLSADRYEDGIGAVAARFVYAHQLAPSAQQALWALIQWREETASRLDRPRRWILSDETLMRIAARRPARTQELHRIKGLAPQVLRFASELIAAITEGAQHETPLWQPTMPLGEDEQRRFDALATLIRGKAENLGLTTTVLATRREIEAAARGNPAVFHSGWRRAVLGREFDAIMEMS
ncbi:MAG: ribonuclease D [Acidiferrobacteraceae bacterium]